MSIDNEFENMMNDFDKLKQLAFEESLALKAFHGELGQAVKSLALKYYPEIFQLESEGYLQLDRAILSYCDKAVLEVNNIVFTYQIEGD